MSSKKCVKCGLNEHNEKYPTCFECARLVMVKCPIGCPLHLEPMPSSCVQCMMVKREYFKTHKSARRAT